MKYKNIFFDLDGTLVDSFEGVTNGIYYSLKFYPNIPVPEREALRVFIGPPLYDSYEKYFGMDGKTATEAVAYCREYYAEKGVKENTVFDGMLDLLRRLKENGARVIMATSKPEVFALKIAEHTGMKPYFDFIRGASLDGSLLKKDDIIADVIEKNGMDKKDIVMIGDTLFDVEGARKNGIDCIAVAYGFGKAEELKASSAVAVADSVKELEELLLKD